MKVIIPAKPYGPGNEDYEYDKRRQEEVDDEAERCEFCRAPAPTEHCGNFGCPYGNRIANLKGELHVRVQKSEGGTSST